MEPSDLHPKKNKEHRLHREFDKQSYIFIMSAIAMILSIIALIGSDRAQNKSTDANAKVNYELHATRSEIALFKEYSLLTDVYLQRVHVIIESNGLEAPPLPERK